jgi:L-malate glycosyltransferase
LPARIPSTIERAGRQGLNLPHSRPLRVLHVISGDLWAGAEVQAFTLLCCLHDAGVEIHAALMNDGELARRLRARNVSVRIFDETQLNGLQILRRLGKYMLELRPDVVHTHRTKENVLGSIANRLTHDAPSLRTVHGASEHAPSGLRGLPKRLFNTLDRWCGVHLQRRVIAVSSDLAAKLAVDFPRDRIVVVHNGVDVAAVRGQVHAVDYRERMPQAVHVGIAGRLVAVKRVDLFLEIAALLRRNSPDRDWRFHVFGDGPLRESLAGRSRSLGIDDVTIFHGHRADIVACIAALDVLVMCSDHEGLPMVLLEAMAVGTPIVAHAVGGMPEVLSGNASAFLVRQHEPEAYGRAIGAALDKGRAANHEATEQPLSASRNMLAVKQIYVELAT